MLITILYLVSFLDALAFSMVIMTMTPYVYSLGGTQSYLGILGSISAAINLVWSPIMGSLSDSLGRKTALLLSIGVAALGNLLVTCSASLVVFFISRLVTTFGTQTIVIVKSLLDDHIKDQETKMATLNKMQAIGGFCFIFGSLIGGHFSEYVDGYWYIFIIITIMYSVNFLLISTIEDTFHNQKSQKQSIDIMTELKKAGTKLSHVNWAKYWDLFTLKLIIDFILGVFNFTFGPIVLTRFGLTVKQFSYVFASSCIISIILSLSLSTIKKRFYADDDSGLKRLIHGCLLLTYSYLGQGLSNSFILYFIHLAPMFAIRTLFDATFTEVILARASPEEKGSIMGTFETTMSFGGLTAPILSGLVADVWGNEMCVLLCTIPLCFATLLAYSQKRKVH